VSHTSDRRLRQTRQKQVCALCAVCVLCLCAVCVRVCVCVCVCACAVLDTQVVRMAGTAGRCVMRVRWSGQDKPRQTYVCAQASRHSRHVPPTHMHVCAHTCAHTSNQAQNIPWYSPRLPLAGVGVRYGQTVRALLRPCGPCQYGGSGDRSVPVVRAHTHGQCERSRYRV